MRVTAAILRRILGMPVEAMPAAILFLAEQLEQTEEFQKKDRERKRNSTETNVENSRNSTEISRARDVEINNKNSQEGNNLFSSQDLFKKNTPPSPSKANELPEPPEFGELLEVYPPRHGTIDRKGSLKAFRAALKRTTFAEILEGARRYRNHMQARGKLGTEFVRQLRTWLNADGWKENYGSGPGTGNGLDNSKAEEARRILAEHAASVAGGKHH